MEIDYSKIKEQEIVNLIAWFVKNKGKDITIHTDDSDIDIRIRKRANYDKDELAETPIVICPII